MPLDETEAVVLKTSPCAEQDKIVVLFSRERGVLRGVAKGARKFGNRFGSSLEPLSIVRAFFYEKERRELVTISNCDLLESFFEAQRDPRVANTAAFFAELIEEFSPPQARDEDLYRLLTTVLRALAAGGDPAFLTAYYEVWFLRLNGLLDQFIHGKEVRVDGLAREEKRNLFPDAGDDQYGNLAQPGILPQFPRQHDPFGTPPHHDVQQQQVIGPGLQGLEAVFRIVDGVDRVPGRLQDGFDPLDEIGIVVDHEQLLPSRHGLPPYRDAT